DMERRACSKRPWWIVSENFYLPLVFYMEEDQEECIFGHLCIEVHSHTFIQLQRWFTATGQTRVIVVGLPEARWLFDTIWSLGSWNSDQQAQGLEMLQLVWSQPLTKEDLATTPSMQLFARD
uniref:KH-like RNA-binding domain-containing protein n=2 Tax=Canis lupus familiaris TaxID=9615 RepID=A0A8C0SYF5_CANLF